MECPSCKTSLTQIRYHGLLVDICRTCRGIWFDAGEMKAYAAFLQEEQELPSARIELDKRAMAEARMQEAPRLCPRCRSGMQAFNYAYNSNIILDKCPSCGGVWTDGGEIRRLAIYMKGNPRLDALTKSVLEEQKEMQTIRDLASLGTEISRNAGWMYMPRIILPLGDDVPRRTFPAGVFMILFVNIAVFAYQSFFFPDPTFFFEQYGLIPSIILSGSGYFTFLSSLFLHGGVLHLAGNMFFFWIFGDNVEDWFGHFPFLGFYLLFGLCASLLHIAAFPTSAVPAIGSSGAIGGVMGAYLVLYPHGRLNTFILYRVIPIPAAFYLGFWILMQILWGSIYFSQHATGGVGWFAHIGGFLSGMLFTWLYKQFKKPASSVRQERIE